MAINKAPMQEPLTSMSWLQWFEDLADGLRGDWTLYTADLIPPEGDTQTGTQSVNIQNMGKSAQIQIKIQSASQGDLTLPFRAQETILRVWDNDSQTLIGGALVSGSLIQLPVISGNVLIEGMVIKWLK